MSCLENDKIVEAIQENLEEALWGDYDLRSALAYKLLDSMEYYLYCKDDAYEYLDDRFEEIYDKLVETMFDMGDGESPACTDIRSLCHIAYGIEIEE